MLSRSASAICVCCHNSRTSGAVARRAAALPRRWRPRPVSRDGTLVPSARRARARSRARADVARARPQPTHSASWMLGEGRPRRSCFLVPLIPLSWPLRAPPRPRAPAPRPCRCCDVRIMHDVYLPRAAISSNVIGGGAVGARSGVDAVPHSVVATGVDDAHAARMWYDD